MIDLLNFAFKDSLTFLFIFVRVGIVFALIPLFGAEVLPRKVTAIIAFFLSLVLLPVAPPAGVSFNMNVLTLIVLILHELLVGLTLGLAVNVIFAGVQIAGELIGYQMGFSIVNVVDPITGVDAPITANLLYILAFLVFLSLGGHHMLIRAMVDSFTVLPVQAAFPRQAFVAAIMTYMAQAFIIGIKVAAPVICTLLLVNVAFAIMSRAIPQMNVFIMAFPVTIGIGLMFMIVVIKMMPGFMESAMANAWAFVKAAMPLY
ncbi:MAG TPA: flagellar biosynthetic protein FliR [Deltaproteobacteria bacterium]|jgi:flagellar biosynthetic protein FliR|nr:flagellar biosynthetic protein FliR [Deltaproteobacteria bacterium]HOI07493.1 flagellar biosynthetic protein FliR [Deltaproteobacteria bacterium]